MKSHLKKLCFFMLILSLLYFTGCQSLLERDYITHEPHSEAAGQEDAVYVPQVSDYTTLRDVVLSTVSEGSAEQTIRLYDYTGNVEDDVQRALNDVMNVNPLGAYAVSSIAYQQTKILTYYEIRFDITYRRTHAQVASIKTVSGIEDFKKYLLDGMQNFSTQLTFDISYYSADAYDAAAEYEKLYYSNPEAAYGGKSISYTLYPDSGVRRIMEISIAYTEPSYNLKAKSRSTANAASDLVKELDKSLSTVQKALALHDLVCDLAEYDEEAAELLDESNDKLSKTDAFTAYGVLIDNKAVCEGYALAYKQLCDEAGIECVVVTGRLQGVPHAWNMIHLSEGWFHVDCTNDDMDEMQPLRQFFAVNDDTLSATHTWDAAKYPVSNQPEPQDILLPQSEATQGTGIAVNGDEAAVSIESPSDTGTSGASTIPASQTTNTSTSTLKSVGNPLFHTVIINGP